MRKDGTVRWYVGAVNVPVMKTDMLDDTNDAVYWNVSVSNVTGRNGLYIIRCYCTHSLCIDTRWISFLVIFNFMKM